MKKLKELYSSPTTELFVVRFEENIMSFDSDNGTETFTPGDDEDL